MTRRERGGAGTAGEPSPRRDGGPETGRTGRFRFPLWIVLVALAAAGLHAAMALTLQRSPLLIRPVLDDGDYQKDALRIVEHVPLPEEIPRASLTYPWLVAKVPPLIGGDRIRSLGVFQALLEGATLLLLMLWVRRRWGTTAAIAGAILYTLDPVGALFAARVTPVTAGTFLFVAALFALDRAGGVRAGRLPGALLFGVASGLGFLLLPLPFLLLAGIVAYRGIRRGGAPPQRPARTAAWASLAVLPLLIAATVEIVHNDSLHRGGPVLNWGSGVALSNAVDPATGGTARHLSPPTWADELTIFGPCWEAQHREGTRYDVFRFYAGRGLRQIAQNPLETLGVVLVKSAATIGAWPVPDALSPAFVIDRTAGFLSYARYSFAVLLGLALAGLWTFRGDRTRRLLLLGVLAVALGCLLGPTSAWARQPALPLLAALGGGWIAALLGRVRRSDPGDRPEPGTAPASGDPAETRRSARSAAAIGLAAGGIAISVAASLLSPTSALENPSEDLRLTAMDFAKQNDLRQSEQLLERAVEADPGNLEARVELAESYQRDGLIDAAAENLRTALEADSTRARTLLAMASLEMARQNPEEAIRLLRKLVALRPWNPLYLNELGQMLARRGEIEEARQLFIRALRIKPGYRTAQTNLQTMETYIRNLENQVFPPEMRLPDDDPMSNLMPVIVDRMNAGDWPGADSLITRLETERPDHVLTHWLRAAYYVRRGDNASGARELEVCDRLAPGRPAVVQLLAGLYIQLGRTKDIDPLFRRSLEAAKDDPTRLDQLQQLQKAVRESTGG